MVDCFLDATEDDATLLDATEEVAALLDATEDDATLLDATDEVAALLDDATEEDATEAEEPSAEEFLLDATDASSQIFPMLLFFDFARTLLTFSRLSASLCFLWWNLNSALETGVEGS